MKTNSLVTFFTKMMFILSVVFLPACQKEVKEKYAAEVVNAQETALKVSNWLESQKSPEMPEKNEVIESVKNNLNLKQLWVEKLSKTESMIIVPILEGFKSAVNKDKNPITNLLLIVNPEGKIRKGSIVQFISQNGIIKGSLPKNTFYNFYNADHLLADGSYTFVNMNDKILYQMQYVNGKVSAYSLKDIRQPVNNNGHIAPPECQNPVNWYWVTTEYYSDGSSTTTSQFLYQTCSGMNEELNPDDPNNGGEVEYIQSPRQLDWSVREKDYSNNLFWWLISTETLSGVKKASEPGGGHYTGITHQGEALFQGGGFVWAKSGVTVSYGGSIASSTVSGVISKNGNSVELITSVKNNFHFSNTFP